MPSLMMPFGPADNQQRQEYLAGKVEELKSIGFTIGGEAKTNLGDWATEILQFIRHHGGTVNWHVPDSWVTRIGTPDFDLDELIEKMRVAESFMAAGLIDSLVLHLGSMRWVEDADRGSFAARYISPFTADEVLEQIQRHIPRYARIAEVFGKERILIENTPLTFARIVDVDTPEGRKKDFIHFLAPQVGTLQVALYVARMIGVGNVLDTGHLSEELAFLTRQSDFAALLPVTEHWAGAVDEAGAPELEALAGYRMWKFEIPEQLIPQPDLRWHVRHTKFDLIHLDGSRASLVNGKLDCELPVMDEAAAKRVALSDILKVARANPDCRGIAIENVGRDDWPFATERPNDWEGKAGTYEYVIKTAQDMG